MGRGVEDLLISRSPGHSNIGRKKLERREGKTQGSFSLISRSPGHSNVERKKFFVTTGARRKTY